MHKSKIKLLKKKKIKLLKKKIVHAFCKILLIIDEPLLKLHDRLIEQYFKLNKKPKIDKKAEKWAKQNPWFGVDKEMTYFAFEVHKKITSEEKVKASSKKYYDIIDYRVYEKFKDRILKFYSHNN